MHGVVEGQAQHVHEEGDGIAGELALRPIRLGGEGPSGLAMGAWRGCAHPTALRMVPRDHAR